MITTDLNKAVLHFFPYSDRIMMMHLQHDTRKINLIEVYVSTADTSEDEIEEFYYGLEEVLETINKHDDTIVMRDFNTKVGQREVEGYVGNDGLEERNESWAA